MKIRVVGDKSNIPFCSSDIIISNLNAALSRLGVHGEDKTVVYDCLGNHHGYKPDAIIACYEFVFPDILLNNIRGIPTFGVGRDNAAFIMEGGHPPSLTDYFCLGVESEVWSFKSKNRKDKLRILGIGESNTRGGLETVVNFFCKMFRGNKNVQLYLRDRSASKLFKTWVREMGIFSDVDIVHDDRDLKSFSAELDVYHNADLAVCLNRSSTWNLRCIECLSTGTPLLAMAYAGHREYLSNEHTGMEIFYDLMDVEDSYIMELQTLGLRNHLFPRIVYGNKTPVWAFPRYEDFTVKLQKVIDDVNLRDRLSKGGRMMAEKFSWERSALELRRLMRNFNEA